jgi:integrase
LRQTTGATEMSEMTTDPPTLRLASDNAKAIPRRVALTKTTIDALACPPDRRDIHVYDAKVPGLAFKLTSNGASAWFLIRRIAGRAQRVRLGGRELTVEQARVAATRFNGEIASGGNPALERRTARRSSTLEQLWEAYRDKHLKVRGTERTIASDENRWKTCFEGWGSRRALGVTEADVRSLHTKLGADKGHVTANRAVQLLRRLYNWARLGVNPASKAVDMFTETTRERFVQPDELPKLFKALDAEETNPAIRDFIYLALFTGARRSNVLAMRDEQLNVSSAVWTIPAASSKNKQAMSIPLSPAAMKIIKARMGHAGGYIFPSDGRTGHLVEPKATWKDVLARAGLKDLRLHDLRRTLGSWQAASGASLPIIGRSLGHLDSATTQIYARLNLDPVRASVHTATAAMMAAAKVKPKRARLAKT